MSQKERNARYHARLRAAGLTSSGKPRKRPIQPGTESPRTKIKRLELELSAAKTEISQLKHEVRQLKHDHLVELAAIASGVVGFQVEAVDEGGVEVESVNG